MSLMLYNTLTRNKEVFTPLASGKVSMYVCGPTVYDYIHIGNARPLIFFDVVRRYLQYSAYQVTYVVNFTDVDDKLIRKAQQLELTVPDVADRFITAYFEDARALGIQDAIHPRVTDNMAEIIGFITSLVEKDLAYESGGDVYFRTARFPDYGKLSQQNLQELQFGIRVEVDERKEEPQDFVLWKKAKEGEIEWDSPWGKGRPGWHIECSAMAEKYLGTTIDIHGGGQDLQFPHHECEIAQSESLHGHPLAHYWLHNGYINIDNEKMSKSLGNGLSVRQLLSKAEAETIRFYMLSTHYRNPLNFNDEGLGQAAASVDRMTASLRNVNYRLAGAIKGDAAEEVVLFVNRVDSVFREKMDDDFNTADALTAVFDLVGETNRYLQQEQVSSGSLELIASQFVRMNAVLGIIKETAEQLLDHEIEGLITERNEARKAKNWPRADEIRILLTDKGIVMEDTPQGLRWYRQASK